MGCLQLHTTSLKNKSLLSDYAPKMEVVRDFEYTPKFEIVKGKDALNKNIKGYPYGMLMPGRNAQESDSYRYGFNGMEKDDEVKGKGNSYTTEFRQYDCRLGRWLSLDPVTHHQFSPYSAFDNNPIYWVDPSGANSGGPEKDEGLNVDVGSYTTKTSTLTSTTFTTYTATTELNSRTLSISSKSTTYTTSTSADGTTSTKKTESSKNNISPDELPEEVQYGLGEQIRNTNPYTLGKEQGVEAFDWWLNMGESDFERNGYDYTPYSQRPKEDWEIFWGGIASIYAMPVMPWVYTVEGFRDEDYTKAFWNMGMSLLPAFNLTKATPLVVNLTQKAYYSKYIGINSKLFAYGRGSASTGILNTGVVRVGWSYNAQNSTHVFRAALGHNPAPRLGYGGTTVFGVPVRLKATFLHMPSQF